LIYQGQCGRTQKNSCTGRVILAGGKKMKIYVRERQKVGEGVESPKFRIIAVTGGQLQIEATHFRKFEVEQIAKDVGAEVVFMKPVADDHKKKH
jgi:hypothetical protein